MNGLKLANAMLISAAAFFGSCLLYEILQYEKHFTWGYGLFVYYVIPTVAMLFFMLALRLPGTMRINFALATASLGGTLFGTEILLGVLTPQSPGGLLERAAKKAGVPFDERSRDEVVTQMREEGIDAYARITPRPLTMDVDGESRNVFCLGGISKVITVMDNESGSYIVYKSDEHGFNNPEGVWSLPVVDVAAVGDSFVQGYGVEPEKNIISLLRSSYANTLNLGQAANGPLMQLASIKEYLEPFRPKIVLWFYYEGNDLLNLNVEKSKGILMRYLVEADFRQGLIEVQGYLDDELSKHHDRALKKRRSENESGGQNQRSQDLKSAVSSILILKNLRLAIGLAPPSKPYDENDLVLFRRILVDARDHVVSWGGVLYLVYLPEWARYGRPAHANKERDYTLSLTKDLDIPTIDIHKIFSQQEDPLDLFPFRLGVGHYNERGYKLIAETILTSLQEKRYRE